MSGTLRLQNKYPNLQYEYDLNGNVTTDSVYNNFSISYDHRNLITELYHIDTLTSTRQYSYATRYWYDEAGNRVRKLTYRNTQIPPPQINDWGNPGNGWTLLNNEHYVRGVDRKELATYTGNTLTEWYIWASDMVGKIKGNAKYFFFKDHLGSVRAVVDNNFNLVSAVDYDMWGDKMQGRIYNGDSTKFGFTGKEEDEESYYNYFGARYYDARLGRWGQVEPLMDKFVQLSPYAYSLNNPIKTKDVDGEDVVIVLSGAGFIFAGSEIGQMESGADDFASKTILNELTDYANANPEKDIDVNGFYSSLGLFGSKDEILHAAEFIMSNLENRDEQVIIYGYSQGGANAIELSDYLGKLGIAVNLLITVDAYDALTESSGFEISDNTVDNFNFYQLESDAVTGARGWPNSSRGKSTRVHNKLKKDTDHSSIDEKTTNDVLRLIYNKIE
ncbi:MAG: RHS repeat-associated core domain-containing protein [Ignavibacteria bacterium]|nr:RHS repeat-associated core domain-containing protein [Ignavibacteria bacterium]